MNTISHIQETAGGRVKTFTPAGKRQNAGSFAEIMAQAGQHPGDREEVHLVGTTSNVTPTVSELVMQDSALNNKGWEIIHNQVNADKPWTSIPEGTAVYYRPSTEELVWKGAGAERATQQQRGTQASTATIASPPSSTATTTELTELGTLSSANPTVSHLLAGSNLRRSMWQILSLPINAGKDFTSVPSGAVVNYDRSSGELSWNRPQAATTTDMAAEEELPPFPPADMHNIAATQQSATTSLEQQPLDLSAAVRQFIGTPYKEMDCYSLVVKGLKNLGVQYGGHDGLYRQLTAKARAQGLPENAYLNGEGLVAATGRSLLHQSFPVVADPQLAADRTLAKMETVMARGQILSFSTPTRGHTGVISQQSNGEWTFINSGRMDHPVTETLSGKEVGEERLVDELQNWFSLARRRNEPLTITLGQVEQGRVAALRSREPVVAKL